MVSRGIIVVEVVNVLTRARDERAQCRVAAIIVVVVGRMRCKDGVVRMSCLSGEIADVLPMAGDFPPVLL